MQKATGIDVTNPRSFKDSLTRAAAGIGDDDFISMHNHPQMSSSPSPNVPSSGKWGGVVICVGVAQKDGMVALRNTNDPDKTTALFTNEEWDVFVKGVKAGMFDPK